MTPGHEIRRWSEPEDRPSVLQHDEAAARQQQSVADQLSHREWDELVDEVVVRIERRVLAELERRGRRYHPEVF